MLRLAIRDRANAVVARKSLKDLTKKTFNGHSCSLAQNQEY